MVHLPINVLEGEGVTLAETYHAGIYFPVFILTDAKGTVLTRWTGYTGADRFINSFNTALSDLTTVDERIARCNIGPTALDAQFLAKYFNDTQEFIKSRNYYRQLHALHAPELNISYQVFTACAEAVWNDQLPFDSLLPAADLLLANPSVHSHNFGRMAQILANVARRTGHTDRIKDYLTVGIRATSIRKDEKGVDLHRDLLADYALHVLNDTAEALSVKKRALGDGWENDPARYFQFGEWCFKRTINLEEAENYVRMATNKASDGKFKARHLRLLSEICYARGKTEEAIRLGEQALDQDPSAVYFEKKLDEWREGQ